MNFFGKLNAIAQNALGGRLGYAFGGGLTIPNFTVASSLP